MKAPVRRPPSYTVQAEGTVSIPKAEYRRIRFDKIRTQPEQEKSVDDDVVSSVAESFIITGQIHPVIVRQVGWNYELIWGVDVVDAARAAHIEWIECRLFEGNDEEAKLLQIAEALFRRELTALEKAEHWAEWADTVLKTKGLFSGQSVSKPGRPEGDLLKTARLLPAYGWRTIAARTKMLARAYKIARLPSDIKKAAKKASLDNNQSALLAIASAGSVEAQYRKLDQLSKKFGEIPEVQGPPLQDKGNDNDDGDAETSPATEDNDDDDDAGESADDDADGEDAGGDGDEEPPPPDTDLKQLRQFLKEHGGKKLWAYTPTTVRKEFVDWLSGRPCKANGDIEPYVKDVFAGRAHIEARVLKAHSSSKGFSGHQVVRYLMSHGYAREKLGKNIRTPWVYKNTDPVWVLKKSSITDSELGAPYKARVTAQGDAAARDVTTNLKPPSNSTEADYNDL